MANSNNDLDIFKSTPKLNYSETPPTIDAAEFDKVVRSRRSVRVYTDEKIPAATIRHCLELALLAPNSSNLQTWSFYWVQSPEKKATLVEACLSQPAAKTAAELIVCVADTKSWKKHCQMMLSILQAQPNVPKSALVYYQKIAPLVYTMGPLGILGLVRSMIFFVRGIFTPTPREPGGLGGMRIWAAKSCALACENLMLALRAHGLDSCPMEGYDSRMVKKLLGLKRGQFPVMVISAGKRANNGIYGPQIRFDSAHFIHQI
jgi:nitroreductase